MACPTCDHTMQKVGVMCEPYTAVGLFWCNRCGTVNPNLATEVRACVPTLAEMMKFRGKDALARETTHGISSGSG